MSASRELQRQLRRIEPCLPRAAKQPPAGPGWIHEIKHDGYRIVAERDHGSMRLYTRKGYDFAGRFPLAAAAIRKLIRQHRIGTPTGLRCSICCGAGAVTTWSSAPSTCSSSTATTFGGPPCLAFNEHYTGDAAIIYKHACALGCEGIVSKRLGSPYRSGRSAHWLKIKNPAAPAVRREAEEEWQ